MIVLTVTEEHLKRGKPTDVNSCPLALCIKERLPKGYSCTVSNTHTFIYPNEDSEPKMFRNSEEMDLFVCGFDSGIESTAPLTFVVNWNLPWLN